MMDQGDSPVVGPPLEDIDPVFRVYETQVQGEQLFYYGDPQFDEEAVLQKVWPKFREHGYEVQLRTEHDQPALVARPVRNRSRGSPWIQLGLATLTIVATLWAGSGWYFVRDPLANPLATVATVWPFTVAVLGVLGVHELAHYLASRRHGVDASLPYFIPVPSVVGTLGAVIAIRGRIPDRKALLDIGASGPIAGVVAAVVVSAIGLLLPPLTVPESAVAAAGSPRPEFGYPLLLRGLAMLLGEPLTYADPTKVANPVLFGGWVGLFVTFLNLLPVGQLDGGHVIRSLLGDRGRVAGLVSTVLLFGLAVFVLVRYEARTSAALWGFWGLLALALTYSGPADPVNDAPLSGGRLSVSLAVLAVAALCFTPLPIGG